jgi:succinylglutamate desuccinylase
MLDRILGTYGGHKPGPLVIVTAAIHGNEHAGVQALKEVFLMLYNMPGLDFKGKFVGLIGNLQAYSTGSRFVEWDFNRIWEKDSLKNLLEKNKTELKAEALEFLELYHCINDEIRQSKPEKVLLLDLHTTSAGGGIFSIPTDEKESLELAKALHAPVVLNLFDLVEGTLLRFAVEGGFSTAGPVAPMLCVAYEAGQHDDPLSVSRSHSAILNTLHFAGCVTDLNLKSPYEKILQKSFAELPKVTRLIQAHHIRPGDAFKMRPGYVNFQKVQQGEHLADDIRGPILATDNAFVLMPLYQAKGSDGFFLVQEEEI